MRIYKEDIIDNTRLFLFTLGQILRCLGVALRAWLGRFLAKG